MRSPLHFGSRGRSTSGVRAMASRSNADSGMPAATALARSRRELGRRYTGGGGDGAALSHQRTGRGVRGARPPPAHSAGARVLGDRRGGRSAPLASPNVAHGVGWLRSLTCLPCTEQTRPPALAPLGRPNLHTTTFRRLLFAASTVESGRISHEVQRRIGARPGSANGLLSRPRRTAGTSGWPLSRSAAAATGVAPARLSNHPWRKSNGADEELGGSAARLGLVIDFRQPDSSPNRPSGHADARTGPNAHRPLPPCCEPHGPTRPRRLHAARWNTLRTSP